MSINLPFWIISLVLIGIPTILLMLDRILDLPSNRLIKVLALPSLIAFVLLVTYLGSFGDPLFILILWGGVGGLVGTVALDSIRLIGVEFNAFPVDMPQIFGAMALGVAPNIPKHIMANMVGMLAELPEERRKEIMTPRLKAISQLPERERIMFMRMMMGGLIKLPEDKRDKVMKTQLEIISSFPESLRANIIRTMDFLTSHSSAEVDASALTSIFRSGLMPKMPMDVFRGLIGKWGVHTKGGALELACKESGRSTVSLVLAGYIWHALNGASYGIAYTLLFGSGSWPLAFAWTTFIWLVMMVSMPKMMPMVSLPYPRFVIFPLLAHLFMAVPIAYFALSYIGPSASGASLFGSFFGLSQV